VNFTRLVFKTVLPRILIINYTAKKYCSFVPSSVNSFVYCFFFPDSLVNNLILTQIMVEFLFRHEAELYKAAAQPLPDEDDDFID
jgi:hypothetical protein